MKQSINVIGVLGSGVMGGGIAQMFAAAGKDVLLWDVDSETREKGIKTIAKRLEKSVGKGTLTTADASAVMERIKPAGSSKDLRSAQLVIEAVIEDEAAKRKVIQEVSSALNDNAIFATNTSSLSVSSLAEAGRTPRQFLGLHFFNPPTKLELVEVVPTPQTDSRTVEAAKELLTECGKTPVVVKDSPGFIVNRLLLLLANEAARMVDEGVASPEDIDTAMRLGALHPAGPLTVADLIGLDTCRKILDTLQNRMQRQDFAPANAIRESVAKGKLGRKSGSGFFDYS